MKRTTIIITIQLLMALPAATVAVAETTWDAKWSYSLGRYEWLAERYVEGYEREVVEVEKDDCFFVYRVGTEFVYLLKKQQWYLIKYVLVTVEEYPDGLVSVHEYEFSGNTWAEWYEDLDARFRKYEELDARLRWEVADAAAEWVAGVPALKRTLDAPTVYATGLEAIDGDTFRVETAGGAVENVRLIGVDAPEIDGPEPEAAACAKERLAELVEGQSLRLVLGVGDARDPYGSLLAYAFAGEYGEHHANILMVREGLASVLTVELDVGYTRDYRRAEEDAREERLGVWE